MLRTSTDWAPWWVIPADHRFVTRALPAGIVTQAINYLEVKPPVVSGEQAGLIAQAKKELGVT